MASISPLSAAPPTTSWPVSSTSRPSGGAAFKDFLLGPLNEVNASQQQAATMVEQLYTGGDVNPAEVMVGVQKADMALRLLLQVRNKLLAAYDEIKNIRV